METPSRVDDILPYVMERLPRVQITMVTDTVLINGPLPPIAMHYMKKSKNCPRCTFTNGVNATHCEMCDFDILTGYFSYINNLSGDTTYVCEGTDVAITNVVCAAEKASLHEGNSLLLVRPGGHHCSNELYDSPRTGAMGFCLVNCAIHIADLQHKMCNFKRIGIIDFDAHMANGTQHLCKKRPNVHVFDMYQHGIFPHMDPEVATNIHTYPLHVQPGGRADVVEHIKTFDRMMKDVSEQSLDCYIVSCGFDGHEHDPSSSLTFNDESYRHFTESIIALGKKTIYLIEGGYEINSLKRCIFDVINAFACFEEQRAAA
jgi:acetoin utilization deacetylase AcuC-like enzyme